MGAPSAGRRFLAGSAHRLPRGADVERVRALISS
jgi:hypothetical protein